MPLPKWMDGYPGAPVPGRPDHDNQVDEPVGLTRCTCGGEGCERCGDTGVIYP